MMNPLTAHKKRLQAQQIESAALDVELLCAHVLGVTREDIILNPPELTAAQQRQLENLLTRRANREPLSHLLGLREFYGRSFKVTKEVLDPRPDTETLVEAALSYLVDPAPNILDLGTGTGCILITLLAELPHAKGVGVDISKAAIEVAQENAELLEVADRATWLHADMKDAAQLTGGLFDVMVSNPPYIATAEIATLMPEVAKYEPKLALDGGKDGLDYYRILATTTLKLLKADGLLCCEIGHTQAADVASIFSAAGLQQRSIHKDLAGQDRCVVFST